MQKVAKLATHWAVVSVCRLDLQLAVELEIESAATMDSCLVHKMVDLKALRLAASWVVATVERMVASLVLCWVARKDECLGFVSAGK